MVPITVYFPYISLHPRDNAHFSIVSYNEQLGIITRDRQAYGYVWKVCAELEGSIPI